ncbi:hypothetical protein [Marinifilum fragile]|uniref:hypothetical protein n=1 Tax=Marinifilum fragile TaxID=570161 RepID=UPI002AA9058C|nr:hypothetical protein [Marinifilum fragile]
MKLHYILLIQFMMLSSCGFSQNLSLNEKKSEKYLEMKLAVDKRVNLQPYRIVRIDEFLKENFGFEGSLIIIKDFVDSNSKLLESILSDSLFNVSRQFEGKCYGLETKPEFYNRFATYKAKLNVLENNIDEFIAQNEALVNVDCYTSEEEYLFLQKSFYFLGQFEPKNVDDYRNKYNTISQSVLSSFEKQKLLQSSEEYIGLFKSKYLTSITIPVCYHDIYFCDIRFTFLNFSN